MQKLFLSILLLMSVIFASSCKKKGEYYGKNPKLTAKNFVLFSVADITEEQYKLLDTDSRNYLKTQVKDFALKLKPHQLIINRPFPQESWLGKISTKVIHVDKNSAEVQVSSVYKKSNIDIKLTLKKENGNWKISFPVGN